MPRKRALRSMKTSPKKFDGYTEAWSKSTFEVKSIKDLMSLAKEFEKDV